MRRVILCEVIAVGMMLAACGKGAGTAVRKATQNYDKVKEGMTMDEVYDLLSAPDYSDGMIVTKKDYWEEENQQRIVVVFELNAAKSGYVAKSKGREPIPKEQ